MCVFVLGVCTSLRVNMYVYTNVRERGVSMFTSVIVYVQVCMKVYANPRQGSPDAIMMASSGGVKPRCLVTPGQKRSSMISYCIR